MAKHLVHDHVDQWYRYFDNPFQRAYNNTCTVNLLYLWCKHLGISCYFSNIFNTTNNDYVDGIDWLLPQSRCIAECILPVINNDAFLFDDNPNLTVDEWSKQKPAVEKYIKPNFVHPNADGHRKIADYIIELLDAKTS